MGLEIVTIGFDKGDLATIIVRDPLFEFNGVRLFDDNLLLFDRNDLNGIYQQWLVY